MLEKLMDEIRQGGTLQPARLAARLNVSVGLVTMMLEDLERKGLIRSIDPSCGEKSCGGCPMVGGCNGGVQGRMWIYHQSF